MPTLLATTKRLDEVGSAVSTPSAITNTVTLADGSGNLERLTWQDLVVALGARAAADLANVQLAYTESGKIPSSLLNLTGFEFQGDYNAGTNSPALADTDTGKVNHLYRVTNSGNPTSKDFGSGSINISDDEYVAYSGASGSGAWINIGTGPKEEIATGGTGATTASGARTNLDVMSIADVNDRANSKAPRNGILLGDDGYLNPPTYPSGSLTDQFTAIISVRFNSLPSGNDAQFLMISGGGTGSSSTNGGFQIETDGTIDASIYDGSFKNVLDMLGGSVTLGRTYRLALRLDSANDGLAVFSDGVKKGTISCGATLLSTPRWVLGASNDDNSGTEVLGLVHYNRALTDSEIADEAVRQVPEVADQWGGSSTYTSDFSSGVDGWLNVNGSALDGDIDGVGGQDDNLRYTVGSSTGEKGVQLSGGWPAGNKRYRLTFDIYAPSGNAALDGYRIKHSVGGELKSQTLTADTWTSVTLDHLSTASGNLKIISQAAGAEGYTGNGSDVFYLRNLKVTGLGAVAAWLPNNVLESGDWQDASPNLLNGIGTGTTALIPNRATYERGAVDDRANSKSPSNGIYMTGTSHVLTGTMGGAEMNDSVTLHIGVKFGAAGGSTISIAKLVNTLASAGASGVCNFFQTSGGALNLSTHDGTAYNAINNAIASIDYDRVYLVSLVSDYVGSGNLIAYVDGEQVGTVAIANQPSLLTTSKLQLGSSSTNNHTGQEIYLATLLNRVQSAAEIAEFAKHLRVLPPDQWGGATAYASDFSSGFDGWSASGGSGPSISISETVGGDSDNIQLTCGTTTGISRMGLNPLVNDQRYAISFDYFVPSSNTDCNGFAVALGSGGDPHWEYLNSPTTDAWTAYRFEGKCSASNNALLFYQSENGNVYPSNPAGTDTLAIRNVVVTPIGAVVALLPTPGSIESDGTWLDSSSNELNGTSTGVTPLYTQPSQRGTFTPTLSFAGNSAGITYSEQLGNWERVGERAIMINGRITLTSKGSNPPHLAHYQGWIHGLPFTSLNANNSSMFTVTGINFAGLTSGVVGMVYGGDTYMKFLHFGSTGEVALDYDNFTNSTTLLFSGTYLLD